MGLETMIEMWGNRRMGWNTEEWKGFGNSWGPPEKEGEYEHCNDITDRFEDLIWF